MSMQLDKRTGFGTRGRPVAVLSNCFQVTRQPDGLIQQYDVAFSDERVKEKRVVMKYLIEKMRIFGDAGIGAVYDGAKILYMPGSQPVPEIMYETSESEARGRPSRPDRPSPKNLKVKITHALQINMLELAQLVQGRTGLDGNILQAVVALNVAIKYTPAGNFPSRKNNFYVPPDPNMRKILGAGLEVWAGYFTSIRPGIGKMIMNFDRGAGAFKMSGNSVEVIKAVMGRRDARDLEVARMPPKMRVKMKRFIKNLTVALKFARDPNAKYKIRAVSDESAANFMFEKEAGQRESVLRYIEDKYNYRVEHPYLPCVQLTKIAWYPLECVSFLPGTQFLGKLEPDQVQEMLKFTTMKPNEKLNALRDGLKHLQLGGNSPTLRNWSFDVEQRPLTVKARVLDPPALTYADSRSGAPAVVQCRDGSWDLKGKRGLKSGLKVDRWFVVVFANDAPGRDGFPRREAQVAINNFVGACRDFGIQFGNPEPLILHVGSTPNVPGAIKDAAKRAGFGKNAPPQLVVTFIANKSSPEYPLIKAACDVTFGVASQNMCIQKVARAKGQYFQNVALKVNVKLAGTNQRIEGWLPGFNITPTMVFGADVTHPGPGSLLPSIAGVVGSCDPHGVKYSTEVRAQNSREEIIMDLEDMTVELLKTYHRNTTKQPARILFYRDGVSEGQFDEVCRREISALKKACARLSATYKPPITYIICGKRHHFRFFPVNQQDGDRSGNVRAGTVVDNDITHPFYSDFYLMSHGGLLGTSRPTHYSVLLDESKLGPDQLQATTNALAYIYARSTRSVSIAAPAYYAHHVCFRARHHLGDNDSSTDAGSMTAEQEDHLRNNMLEAARAKLTGVNIALKDTLYFM